MGTSYADYDFYVNTFQGELIPLDAFARLAQRASAVVDQVTHGRAGSVSAETDTETFEKVQLATCAVAEELHAQEQNGGVVLAESIGRHAVTYATPVPAERRVLNAARLYLERTDLLYRGLNADE